jgi:XTP/dITP diphosphohydrolase
MIMELLVATKNKKKLKEIKEILKDLNLKITSLADLSSSPRIVENKKTFKENAIKKAVRISKVTASLVLGEDSGLCVDALGGRPGVYSARFGGKDKNDEKNNKKLLKELEGLSLSKRRAHYVCAVAIADKGRLIDVAEGKCGGLIGFKTKGHFGFGYDPLFIIPGFKKTFAQLGPSVKHSMSHRSRALVKSKKIIQKYIEKNKSS